MVRRPVGRLLNLKPTANGIVLAAIGVGAVALQLLSRCAAFAFLEVIPYSYSFGETVALVVMMDCPVGHDRVNLSVHSNDADAGTKTDEVGRDHTGVGAAGVPPLESEHGRQ